MTKSDTNICKCAGCSLQKGALNIGIFLLMAHIGFVVFYYIRLCENDLCGNYVYSTALKAGFKGNKHYFPNFALSNEVHRHQESFFVGYLVAQYIVVPFMVHILLIYAALSRSSCASNIWIVYTVCYIIADVIFKMYLFHWYGLLFIPVWIFHMYCIVVVHHFKEEIHIFGEIILPRRTARCPYYFSAPKGYDYKQDFLTEEVQSSTSSLPISLEQESKL